MKQIVDLTKRWWWVGGLRLVGRGGCAGYIGEAAKSTIVGSEV
jgi:hypothetical protein